MSPRLSPITNVAASGTRKLLISLLVGEMSGRTEGGAKDRNIALCIHALLAAFRTTSADSRTDIFRRMAMV
ncbi:hypothetical protein X755_20275 [Mesorhizobium sp. LNJC405B00]|nr:hypothetical protein X755_20275 [Mesorhizobium sp. LNJC405B00]